jgi:hypothetical protein
MISLEDIKLYLPKYLSSDSEENLFQNLKDFPNNIYKRMYSNLNLTKDYKDIILQGDGMKGLLVINLPDKKVKKADVVIISNTCDIDQRNPRLHTSSICYSPIINLEKFISSLKTRNIRKSRIDSFVNSLKKQQISQIFFLPKGEKLASDSFIFFGKITSCNNDYVSRKNLHKMRIFSLSNYGFYIFLFKLSIHFSRIREEVERG